jgi:hypothetical protein
MATVLGDRNNRFLYIVTLLVLRSERIRPLIVQLFQGIPIGKVVAPFISTKKVQVNIPVKNTGPERDGIASFVSYSNNSVL